MMAMRFFEDSYVFVVPYDRRETMHVLLSCLDVGIVSEFLCKGKKVKCTLVQALRICTGRTAHRGTGGIAVLYRH